MANISYQYALLPTLSSAAVIGNATRLTGAEDASTRDWTLPVVNITTLGSYQVIILP